MVSQCANPQCGKPLHYLREGKVFLLHAQGSGGQGDRMEHFWLCGECSLDYIVKEAQGHVEVVSRLRSRRPAAPLVSSHIGLAS